MIIEAIVTTTNENGTPNISPMGPIIDKNYNRFELRPFSGSQTLVNLKLRQAGVVHFVDDGMIFAQALTHQWLEPPALQLATIVAAPMLKDFLRAFEFKTTFFDESSNRVSVMCETLQHHVGQLPRGLCRGLNAVVEACILVSRADFLPREEVDTQLQVLDERVKKTGNQRDMDAMKLLLEHHAKLIVS